MNHSQNMEQSRDQGIILKKYICLCIYDDYTILLSKINKIFLYDIKSKTKKTLYTFKYSLKDIFAQLSPWLRRLLRVDSRYAIRVNQNTVLIIRNRTIYEFDIKRHTIVSEVPLPRGSRPLNITLVNALNGFEDGVYFGEYFNNPEKHSVRIFRYVDHKVTIVHEFDSGSINHIHNLIVDSYRNCVWILTGDFGAASSIYIAKDNFKYVEQIVSGDQKYRSCVGFPSKEGLIYATDSQTQTNSIRILTLENGVWISSFLHELNGPCIHSCQIGSYKYFSTSVEGGLHKNRLKAYTTRTPGPGIISNKSTIVRLSPQNEAKNIYSREKDTLPFVLFQFGNIIFPTGVNNINKLIFSNISLKQNDLSTTIIDHAT
jgi:hypothetical protein